MFRIHTNFWRFLRESRFFQDSDGLVILERRITVFFLCLLFALGQSAPAALAMASSGSNSWVVVCTGAGLQIIQTDAGQDEIPVDAQTGCTCCLAPNSAGFSPELPRNSLAAPLGFHSVSYVSAQYCNSGHLSRQGLSCRGPPSGAYFVSTFSYPPDTNIGVTDWYLRRIWL